MACAAAYAPPPKERFVLRDGGLLQRISLQAGFIAATANGIPAKLPQPGNECSTEPSPMDGGGLGVLR
jgi:hypothetical protein